jgi:hypothetical protein
VNGRVQDRKEPSSDLEVTQSWHELQVFFRHAAKGLGLTPAFWEVA